MPRSTVAAVLGRVRVSRLSLLEPPKPAAVRYERGRAGELVHLDVKPLGKIGVIGHRTAIGVVALLGWGGRRNELVSFSGP